MAPFQRSLLDKPKGKEDKKTIELDVIIIGAGFAGIYLLYKLRKEGYNAKIVEAGETIGGVWYWNNYPGARVDSEYPVYALAIPEVYENWRWSERYPGAPELQRYFQHVDNVLDISKDTIYNTRVDVATWDDNTHHWELDCDNETHITARYMMCCVGFAAKRHFPDWPGFEDYKGYLCHSSFWPAEGVDMKGKRMAVIGSGATGIQIAQSAAREAGQLGVFIRTPNITVPMNQQPLTLEQSKKDMETMEEKLQKLRYETQGGFLFHGEGKGVFDDPPEKRDQVLQSNYDNGGFGLVFCYNDILLNEKSNRYVYDFVNKRTRARMSNPEKRDFLAPVEPVHPFAGKRPSLEQDYYEQMDKDHVELINCKETPISHLVENGIVTKDGKVREYDIIAVATGFDSLTGSFMEIDFTGVDGEKLYNKWNGPRGAMTYMGISVHKFPNMFYTYGPQAPTAFGNGPSITEPQGDWIAEVLNKMKKEGLTKIDANDRAEQEWKDHVEEVHSKTLRHNLDSWYMGSNIPGKPRQALNYAGGLPFYIKNLHEKLDNNYEGFTVS